MRSRKRRQTTDHLYRLITLVMAALCLLLLLGIRQSFPLNALKLNGYSHNRGTLGTGASTTGHGVWHRTQHAKSAQNPPPKGDGNGPKTAQNSPPGPNPEQAGHHGGGGGSGSGSPSPDDNSGGGFAQGLAGNRFYFDPRLGGIDFSGNPCFGCDPASNPDGSFLTGPNDDPAVGDPPANDPPVNDPSANDPPGNDPSGDAPDLSNCPACGLDTLPQPPQTNATPGTEAVPESPTLLLLAPGLFFLTRMRKRAATIAV